MPSGFGFAGLTRPPITALLCRARPRRRAWSGGRRWARRRPRSSWSSSVILLVGSADESLSSHRRRPDRRAYHAAAYLVPHSRTGRDPGLISGIVMDIHSSACRCWLLVCPSAAHQVTDGMIMTPGQLLVVLCDSFPDALSSRRS